jgi:hypothetical protein
MLLFKKMTGQGRRVAQQSRRNWRLRGKGTRSQTPSQGRPNMLR